MKKNWNNWNLLFTNLSTGKTFLVTNTYNILHGGKTYLIRFIMQGIPSITTIPAWEEQVLRQYLK
jgi:hypothetical protein